MSYLEVIWSLWEEGAGEMAQQLWELAALVEELGLVPSIHIVTHFSSRRSDALFWPLWAPSMHMAYIYSYT